MTEEFKAVYLDKCAQLQCQPLLNVIKQVDEAIHKGEPLKDFKLKGISKTKLNERLDSNKVGLRMDLK